MTTDYYSLISDAVADAETAEARERIYNQARQAVASLRPDAGLSLTDISAQVLALEKAIQEIESEIAAGSEMSPVDAEPPPDEPSSRTPPPTRPSFAGTAAPRRPMTLLLALIAAGAVFGGIFAATYFYATRAGSGIARNAAPSPEPARRPPRDDGPARAVELDPGIDGGSAATGLPFQFQRQVVFYRTTIVPGSIVIDRSQRYLYLVQSNNVARRYGIGLSQECMGPGSMYRIAKKSEWPQWEATQAFLRDNPKLPQILAGGPGNPLGARALYLDPTDRYIHGTNAPLTVGQMVARGCIRLVNDDIVDLYDRVPLETRVIMRN